MLGLKPKDWAMTIAALLGPILAVQAQKAFEALREQRRRRTYLIEQLMETRATRLAPEHVWALNMVDQVPSGERVRGVQRRSTKEQRVLDAWKEYHDHLNAKAETSNFHFGQHKAASCSQISFWPCRKTLPSNLIVPN